MNKTTASSFTSRCLFLCSRLEMYRSCTPCARTEAKKRSVY